MEEYFAWTMHWRLQHLLVKQKVAQDLLEDIKGMKTPLTKEQVQILSKNAAQFIRDMTVARKSNPTVNVYFSWCDIEEEARMVMDLDDEVGDLLPLLFMPFGP